MRQPRWRSAGALAVLIFAAAATFAWTGTAGGAKQAAAAAHQQTASYDMHAAAAAPVPGPAPSSAPHGSRQFQGSQPPAPCYYSIFSDPDEPGDNKLDISQYRADFECPAGGGPAGTWTFKTRTFDAWPDGDLDLYRVFIDEDANPSTGCGGFGYELIATNNPGLEVRLFRTLDCFTVSEVPNSGAAVGRADGFEIDAALPAASIGSPKSLVWGVELRDFQGVNDDTDFHGETGYAGDGCSEPGFPFSVPTSSFAIVDNGSAAAAALRSAGQPGVEPLANTGVVRFSGDPSHAMDALSGNGIAASVSPDVARAYTATPNDPDFAQQWDLTTVKASEAWDKTKGSANVLVADLDSGFDGTHADLQGKLASGGFDAETGQPLDEHADTDNVGHGTATAGIIAAATDNLDELASLGWNTRVLPIKLGDIPLVSSEIAALKFAADHGAPIANLSFGGPCPTPAEANAIKDAQNRGVLLVASAGNDAENGDRVSYPAAYPNVLAVGATGFDGTRARYSNYGSYVDMTAPGGSADGTLTHDLLVLKDGGGVIRAAGTSFAAPLVSAAAALVKAVDNSLSLQARGPNEIAAILMNTAADAGPAGRDDQFGRGILDANAAVIAAQVPPTTTTTAAPTTTTPPTTAPPATTGSTLAAPRAFQTIATVTPVATPQAQNPSFVG